MLTREALVEGLIFASASPVSRNLIEELFSLSTEESESVLLALEEKTKADTSGFVLTKVAGGYQFRTKEELKEVMARFHEKKPPRLTQAALEVLSIISYKQPITRPEIEKIRGVDCTSILKTLLDRELIEMRGRSDLPGHPVVYGTTGKFLEWFQINSLADLPPLSEMELLNRGREEGMEHLIDSLTRDDGFQAESLGEMDQTLKSIQTTLVDDSKASPEEKAAGAALNEATTSVSP